MFTIWTNDRNHGGDFDTVDDANAFIADILTSNINVTVCCELTDDGGDSLSYWEFNRGDSFIPGDAQP
jgi:hypothetical protein